MSQTETILLVVLGFALASLMALFIGRMVWGLGLRLGARRMRKQVPFTVQSLQTERDRLRADYAMLGQRLGAKLEALKLRSAEQMAEVSRLRNRIEANISSIAAKDAELAARHAEIEELGKTIASLELKSGAAGDSAVELRAEIAARDAEIAMKDAEISSLKLATAAYGMEHTVAGLPYPAPLPTPLSLSPEERLKARIGQIANMSRTIGNEQLQPEAALPVEPEPEPVDFHKDLERLDAEWSKRIEEIEQPQQSSMPKSVANVISLANRIRALKREISK